MALAVSIEAMREPIDRGVSRPVAWRLEQLDRLAGLLSDHEAEVLEALASDLGKAPLEATFELVAIRQELAHTRRRLRGWMAPQSVAIDLALKPARAFLQAEPLGCVLIIGPWNYPFQLALLPLVSALAAGNAAVLKPSEHAPQTAALLARLLPLAFPPEVIQVVTGDGAVAAQLLEQRFDHIFFTGGSRVGRLVMAAAAKHLTPVTLELGGKNPAIVLGDANLAVTARRLVWGKGLNGGQTCVAPDHLLVVPELRAPLIQAMAAEITRFYGDDPLTSPDLGAIVNQAQFDRLEGLLAGAKARGQVLAGGRSDRATLRIEPTLVAVDGVAVDGADDPLMREEIFGPILPVITIAGLEAGLQQVRSRPKPLALYLFSNDKNAQRRTLQTTSGLGTYHGRAGFLTFSHQRSVLARPFWLDLPFRYPPYKGKLGLVKWLLG